jgi:HEPN domain-containing protein
MWFFDLLRARGYDAGVKDETVRWLRRAEEDLTMAEIALQQKLPENAIFHSHEAVEKTLKAMWIDRRGELAEKTHNLPYLAKSLGLELTPAQTEFLRKLYWQLIPSRYPEGEELSSEAARWYYLESVRFCEWLRHRLS